MLRTISRMPRYICWYAFALAMTTVQSCKKVQSNKGTTKITGGQVAAYGDAAVKSTVSLRKFGRSYCTGTLIGPNHIVTAAHCVARGMTPDQIGFGVQGFAASQISDIRAVSHPNYDVTKTKVGNDIAVIAFHGRIPEGFVPVDVAPANAFSVGTVVLAAGYGITEVKKGDGGILRQVPVHVAEIYPNRREFLAGDEGKGACQGDSGGPIYIMRGNAFQVIGATSRGKIPCTHGSVVYADVTRTQGWMKCAFQNLNQPLSKLMSDDSSRDCNPVAQRPDDGRPPSPSRPSVQRPDDGQPSTPSRPTRPSQQLSTQGGLLDCNSDYSKITAGALGKVCFNPSTGNCYQYYNRDVQYGLGPVSCHEASTGGGSGAPPPNYPSSGSSILDCNKDFSRISAGGSGTCVNTSYGGYYCYQYSNGNVQYNAGTVSCR